MELKAQYDLNDLLGLVEKDLAGKGFKLVGGFEPVITSNATKLSLGLAIEQFNQVAPAPAPALAAPAQVEPKPKQQRAITEKELARRANISKRMREANLAKKSQTPVQEPEPIKDTVEVVAPSTVPFHHQQLAINGQNR